MPNVFISYIREDEQVVRRLAKDLALAGITVWIDRDKLLPGVYWKTSIRNAISQGDYFLACFSAEYSKKNRSFMNEELLLAISELRQRQSDQVWFIPVVLSETLIPDFEIGGGRTLRDIQWIELYRDWDVGIRKIIYALRPGFTCSIPIKSTANQDLVVVKHNTRYRFDRPVHLSEHIIRLRPVRHCSAPIIDYKLSVSPASHSIKWDSDRHGNSIAKVTFPSRLTFIMIEVEIIADIASKGIELDFLRDRCTRTYSNEQKELFTPYLLVHEHEPNFISWCESIDIQGLDGLDSLIQLSRTITHTVNIGIQRYPNKTCEEVLQEKRGGGKELAWLLVQLLRYYKFAARFVSGYSIQMATRDTEVDLAILSAWAEVFIPEYGWIGIRPEDGSFALESDIPVACTAEVDEAQPIEGFTEKCDVDFEFSQTVKRL